MFSTTSEYALRALVALASDKGGRSTQARELARATEVPPSYLYKILAALRRAKLLAGTRGSRGGYCLARDPQDIRLLDVVSLFEEIRPTEACLLKENHICDDAHPCSAHHHWKHVQRCYREFLETKTIADLATKDVH
ncbi:MAG: Rrf2 family transcriptional regulator [Acidobacteria bacterium]|nr:Rrf2 family transcriptional regulator [Acidobacteriota bacterium]NIM62513.1 Rrf2 family transcriptional regulator [Acidobacteriota bacterium]NIO60584.1 Rrf2 family transcriptional regulator [Acidobacteriota bacterium]NIQ29319.1 Rrf2 family transcriptional regulator [Acidobacteriota bacterium]NIQ83919.1 Rrf2 family transcriptional regulator [Acidobacteriota bacterium]